MPVRTSCLSMSFLVIVSLATLALTGCASESACMDECTPRGPWQSPTTQALRALLLVNTEELKIESLDGEKEAPSCVNREEVREYYLRPGVHTIAATFNYDVSSGEGSSGEVEGQLLTTEHNFQAGHVYVALYREHRYPKPCKDVGEVASNARASDEKYYWTLEFVDLAEASLRCECEVRDAQRHCDWIMGTAKATD